MINEIATELTAKSDVIVKTDVIGAKLCTFAIGGPIEYLVEVQSVSGLQSVLRTLHQASQEFRVLGAGSNVLIPTVGLPGWTIKLGRGFRTQSVQGGSRFVVGGSVALMSLSRELSEAGLAGLEFAGGIPASLGGAVRMNAGAHGSELAEVIERISIVARSGDLLSLSASELSFGYRYAGLPEGSIVYEVELKLTPSDPETTGQKRRECLNYRKRTQPLTVPSAGSIFRNPAPEQPAGKVIEQLGLRGETLGGASISNLHGNWIVNEQRTATSEDVSGLIAFCQEQARAQLDLELQPELVRW